MAAMCGRFTLKTKPEQLAEQFDLPEVPWFEPRYNIAPTQPVVAVRAPGGTGAGREAALLRWGLIPSWAEDPAIGNRLINARAESIATKPAFRSAFKQRRCLVLADGFYEWAKTTDTKQPHYIRMRDGRPFAFAGLWERWSRGAEPIESCTLITTTPNDVLCSIHDRMPVILEPADYDRWLDRSHTNAEELMALLQPYAPEAMECYPVSLLVNNPRHEEPGCIEPVPGP